MYEAEAVPTLGHRARAYTTGRLRLLVCQQLAQPD